MQLANNTQSTIVYRLRFLLCIRMCRGHPHRITTVRQCFPRIDTRWPWQPVLRYVKFSTLYVNLWTKWTQTAAPSTPVPSLLAPTPDPFNLRAILPRFNDAAAFVMHRCQISAFHKASPTCSRQCAPSSSTHVPRRTYPAHCLPAPPRSIPQSPFPGAEALHSPTFLALCPFSTLCCKHGSTTRLCKHCVSSHVREGRHQLR